MKSLLNKIIFISLLLFPLGTFGANQDAANFIAATSQLLSAADSTTIRVDDTWTVGFWYLSAAKPTPTQQKIMTQRSGENGWGVAITTDGFIRLFAGAGAFSNADSNVNHSDNAWHHVRIYWNGANTKLYVDNVLENTLNVPAITPPNVELDIGSSEATYAAFFDGKMDDVRIYNDQWDGTNYNCKLTSQPTDLKAHWDLDGATPFTDNLLDATANGNNLTNHNTVTFITTSLPYTADCAGAAVAPSISSNILFFD